MTARIFRSPPQPAALRLLADASLPAPERFEHFWGCGTQDSPQGVVGLELYGEEALLRSLTVDAAARGRGCSPRARQTSSRAWDIRCLSATARRARSARRASLPGSVP